MSTLAALAKKINRLKGEIADLKDRIKVCNRAYEEEEYEEKFEPLQKKLEQAVRELVEAKNKRMKANIENGKYRVVLMLGEMKSMIEFYSEIDTKEGISRQPRFMALDDKAKALKYKAQFKTKEKRIKMDELKKRIEDLTDELDEFNAKTRVD